ncbi:MAG: hypothetical protein K2J91_07360 [Lachnospiraceae bacterium]|nr:hypothetical protein [Lachnospiraceae bacterium]
MKKRFLVLMLAAMTISSFAFTGCGDSDDNTSVTTTAGGNNNQTTSPKGYVFERNGVTIGMDMEAAPIIEALGEPASYFEAASCAFEGLDKMYGYGSFEIDTYELNGKDYISTIIFNDDMVSTKEGVSLFDKKEDMISAYGDNYSNEQGMYVYTNDNMKLKFVINGDDEISSIMYTSTIIDAQ